MTYDRIITHDDFDGIVSAALCSRGYGCDRVRFTGPGAVARAAIPITAADIVCDLPYPLECGLWFDHHGGNLEAVRLRGIDPASIPGRFAERPSCARVVFEHLADLGIDLPGWAGETVAEADRIDSFDYRSVEEWRRETPGRLVDMSLKADVGDVRERTAYLETLVFLLRDNPIDLLPAMDGIASRIERYRGEEARMIEFLRGSVSFLDGDEARELVILDLTHHKRRPRVMRNLAYLIYPEALGVVSLYPIFRGGRKANGFAVSISLSMNLTGRVHGKNAGEIVRSLNIGDGHPGAAAGTVECGSKDEMLREKRRVLEIIWRMWRAMPAGEAP